MKSIRELRELVAYDPVTGEFCWLQDAGPVKEGDRAGSVTRVNATKSYLVVKVRGRKYYAHSLAWAFVHGGWPEGQIDHLDGNTLNNRIENLRCCNAAINQHNRKQAQRNSATGLMGVSPSGSRFMARIKVNMKRIYLGTFDTATAAHEEYIKAKRSLQAGNLL